MSASATELTMRILGADPGVVLYASDRVHPGMAPQGTEVPYITVSLVSEEQEDVLAGHTDGYQSRVSIACHATHYSIADAMGEEVKACLSEVVNTPVYDGASPPELLATVTAWKATTDLIDHDDARTIYRRILDYKIRWTRP